MRSFGKIFRNIASGVFLSVFMSTAVFAASASINGDVEKTAKGRDVKDKTLTISVTAGEVEAMKDSIKISLEGAEWNGFSGETKLAKGITCQKTSANEIALHVTPDETMLKNGWSVKVPLNCRIIANIDDIMADVDWGLQEYTVKKVRFAKCDSSYAYLNGTVKDHKKGDKIFRKGSKVDYNELKISILGQDAESRKNKIKVTLDGAEWSDLDKQGEVACNYYAEATYEKLDNKTIQIEFTNFKREDESRSYYTLTMPLTGTITGEGEIKAKVDFGDGHTPEKEIVFARCPDGTLEIKSSDPNKAVDLRGNPGDIVISDTSTQSYGYGKKIGLKLNFSYRFTDVPRIECTGKFDGKCRIELDKNDKKQCYIIFTQKIESGETGTITLKDIVIERPENNVPNRDEIKVTMNASGWEEYESTIKIAQFKSGAEYYQPTLRITAKNPNAQANDKYAFLGTIHVEDISSSGYKQGDRIEMSFDKGFEWFKKGAEPSLAASGKFSGKCEFAFDEKDGKKAYIAFTADIPSETGGSIDLNGAVLQRNGGEAFETVNMTAGLLSGGKDTYTTMQAAKFSSLLSKIPETTETTTEAATEATTETAKNAAVFKIGSKTYTQGGEEKTLAAAPYIKNGYTMLPMRAFANLVGIENDKISYSDGTAVFVLDENRKLFVTSGEEIFEISGTSFTASAAAENVDGAMFLPMRDLLNALGIDNDSISFNAETKEITVVV